MGPGDGGVSVDQNFNNGSGDFHMARLSVPDDHFMLSGHVDNYVGPETGGRMLNQIQNGSDASSEGLLEFKSKNEN